MKIPIHPWEWPYKPWQRIRIDFAGPMLDKQFLVIVDTNSKWPEVFPMNKITTTKTIEFQAALAICVYVPLHNILPKDSRSSGKILEDSLLFQWTITDTNVFSEAFSTFRGLDVDFDFCGVDANSDWKSKGSDWISAAVFSGAVCAELLSSWFILIDERLSAAFLLIESPLVAVLSRNWHKSFSFSSWSFFFAFLLCVPSLLQNS